MKASFMLPSATYNIVLSKEDLERLLEKGYVSAIVNKNMPCTTGRAVWNQEKETLETLDRKEIWNNLRFNLHSDVADIKADEWAVQYLNILIDKGEKT